MNTTSNRNTDIRLNLEGRHLEIRVVHAFRDDLWAERFGEVIRIVRTADVIDALTLDLRACRWADPLPLLSSLITLREALAAGINAKVHLPGDSDQAAAGFRNFLAQEGFLDQLAEMEIESSPVSESRRPHDHSGPSLLSAQCIPMRVFDTPADADDPILFSKDLIDDLLEAADSLFQARIPRWARADLVYRLRLILQETLTNILEHAYPGRSSGRWAGLYVRYRAGGLVIPQGERQKWRAAIDGEHTHCPKIFHQFLEGRVGCIEVYVLDAGIGMVESMRAAGLEPSGRYPFAYFFQQVLQQGATSKPGTGRPTVAGGLQVMHDILESHGDILRGLNDRTWAGIPAGQWEHYAGHRQVISATGTPGLDWTIRLSWKEKTDQGRAWQHWQGNGEHPVLRMLRGNQPDDESEFGSRPVFDRRFPEPLDRAVIDAPDPAWCLWLVSPGRLKNDILREAGRIVSGLPQAEGWTLWIADIPVHEAGIYLAAFEGFNRDSVGNQWAATLDQIILVTIHWSLVILKHRLDRDTNDAHGYVPSSDDAIALLNAHRGRGIDAFAAWLRWHDSRRLWDAINAHRGDLTYLPETVDWRRDESEQGYQLKLDGYLDFTQTLSESRCLDLYRQALRRIPGLFEGRQIRLSALDDLTSTLTESFNGDELHPDPGEAPRPLVQAIGSVMVTGTTSRRSARTTSPPVHFFVHPAEGFESIGEIPNAPRLFLWLPGAETTKSDEAKTEKYDRLGQTPLIAPGGRKYFTIPRFDPEGRPLAERTPTESYLDWQEDSEILLRSGHWCYESHHDFLTINLHLAVNRAFLNHGPLAAFLVSEFFQALGIQDDRRLSEKGKYWWARLRLPFPSEGNGLLVYPSHPNTELVVERILACFHRDYRDDIRRRIIPVLPVRRQRGGEAMLISPLILERIRRTMERLRTRRVTLFDDAAVSGNTFRQLRAFIKDLDAEVAKSVFILNRIRLPAYRRTQAEQRFFWRLDLPVMGNARTCPLCRALNLVAHLSNRIVSDDAQQRLRDWRVAWQKISPTSDWGAERGIPALAIKPSLEKKFGKCMDDRKAWVDHKVDLAFSPAVAAYNGELRTMTGLNDQALVFDAKQNRSLNRLHWHVQIELFASQLLLFGHEHESGTLSRTLVSLLTAAFTAPDTDDSTALAALTFLVLADEHLALPDLVKKALDLSKIQQDQLNLDLRIAIAALIDRGLLDREQYSASRRLLSSAGLSLAERYRLLYEETEGTLGAAHSTPLPRWVNTDDVLNFSRRRLAALNSLDKLRDIIQGLGSSLARNSIRPHGEANQDGSPQRCGKGIIATAENRIQGASRGVFNSVIDPDSYSTRTDAMLDEIRQTRTTLSKVHCDGAAPSAQDALIADSRRQVEMLLEQLAAFRNDFFFLPMRLNDLQQRSQGTLETDVFPAMFNDINWTQLCGEENHPELGISLNLDLPEKSLRDITCVPWDQPVIRMLGDLLSNARHATESIADPWELGDEQAHLWIRVTYEDTYVLMQFVNTIAEPADVIWGKVAQRGRQHWEHLKGIGGTIDLADRSDNLFEINVRLPYVYNCQSAAHPG